LATSIIAITGPSGSGKTYLARSLYREMQNSFPGVAVDILAEDSYYHDQAHVPEAQRQQVNYDHPSALEHELLLEHLLRLKAGEVVNAPTYDYTRHTRSEQTRQIEPTHLLILEGILLLSHQSLREHYDLSLFVDTPLDVCLQRRMQRDCEERGRSPESVTEQFEATVRPMFHEHIEPTREHAHLVLSGQDPAESMASRVRQELEQRGYLIPEQD